MQKARIMSIIYTNPYFMKHLKPKIAEGDCMRHMSINIGNSAYLSRRRVIICEILPMFHLVVVRYENDLREFIVDKYALSASPQESYSIPITLFKEATV